MGDSVAIALLGALGLLLVSAGIEDARVREIANWKNAVIALFAPAWWWAAGYTLWPDVGVQLIVAALVFGLFVAAFALGQMGGGDVKLIGALALWIPPTALVWMLIIMSLIGGLVTIVLLIEARWQAKREPLEIPYGVAIAIAALLWIREPIFNHFG
ncbi:prepilin peptidase [Sphingomonas donggukensis]|uniref:Prepilin peptidase n=1 Tax=Sphingomonas donggukensis TaxID=2949093 RepID=A0ABY4TVT1_9SPHN|nr:prepilin peptidase [Sphingomonas donggukensis]URW75985.1 prepilin peptidase [Sphingomonas donggukensis]